MSEQRLSEADVERVSQHVANKLVRYALIAFFAIILFVLALYIYRASGP